MNTNIYFSLNRLSFETPKVSLPVKSYMPTFSPIISKRKIRIGVKSRSKQLKHIKNKHIKKSNIKQIYTMNSPKIILLVRSYNRPEYLEPTLKSLLASDIDKCIKRYIYDDGSNDNTVNDILTNDEYINQENKQFTVIKNEQNVGCHQSFTNAMNYIKQNNAELDYVLIVDNDVVVKSNFVSVLCEEFMKASAKYETKNLLFTGFNCTNAHLNMIEDNGTYYRKQSCGAVNWFFHSSFIDFIILQWSTGSGVDDWRVINEMNRQNMPICCTKPSVVNHTGQFGLFSNGRCDTDCNF